MRYPNAVLLNHLEWAKDDIDHDHTIYWKKGPLNMEWIRDYGRFLIYPAKIGDDHFNLWVDGGGVYHPFKRIEKDLSQKSFLLYIRATKEAEIIQERWDEIFG